MMYLPTMRFVQKFHDSLDSTKIMKLIKTLIFCLLMVVPSIKPIVAEELPVWPEGAVDARIKFVREIRLDDLKLETSFLGKIGRIIGGSSEAEQLSLPFDLEMAGDKLFMVCQNLPALVEINISKNSFKLHTCKEKPFEYPVSLCVSENEIIYITDSKNGTIYQFDGKTVKPLISDSLVRPTGIATAGEKNWIYVVDTGDHSLKIFDINGIFIKQIIAGDSSENALHFPTFATADHDGNLIVNDALNYKIRRYNSLGNILSSFGEEGDSPGSFSRPKGIAVDSDGHIYVIDNMQDNLQVFDIDGRLLLVIGQRGRGLGEFWSPGGIEINNDTIYIADTFNDRIQVLAYVGETEQ